MFIVFNEGNYCLKNIILKSGVFLTFVLEIQWIDIKGVEEYWTLFSAVNPLLDSFQREMFTIQSYIFDIAFYIV